MADKFPAEWVLPIRQIFGRPISKLDSCTYYQNEFHSGFLYFCLLCYRQIWGDTFIHHLLQNIYLE